MRSHSLTLIREMAALYDSDGLELAWLRGTHNLRPGCEREDAPLQDFIALIEGIQERR